VQDAALPEMAVHKVACVHSVLHWRLCSKNKILCSMRRGYRVAQTVTATANAHRTVTT